jgi:hypothetical protein
MVNIRNKATMAAVAADNQRMYYLTMTKYSKSKQDDEDWRDAASLLLLVDENTSFRPKLYRGSA